MLEERWYPAKQYGVAWKIIKKDFTYPWFLISLSIMILLVVWAVYIQKNSDRLKQAATSGLIAFIIAYLARLDLVFIAFIFTVIFVFFLSEEDDKITSITKRAQHQIII